MSKSITNAIVIADTHCGCQLGLCPPEVQLGSGGTYKASKFQMQIWKCWRYFWDVWVPRVTRGEPFCVVFNGDMTEGRHHRSVTQISQDKSDQEHIAYECLAPIVELCKGEFYYVSGSEAHAGVSGEDEDRLGKRLGAVPDSETGKATRYELYMKVGDALVHFSHHIGVSGSMAYETTALTKEFQEFCSESARWRRPIPDIVVRSHRHRHAEVRVPTKFGYGTIFVTAGWQLRTPWLFRVPGGRVTTPMLGGSLIRQGDEEAFTRHRTWETNRTKTVKPVIPEKWHGEKAASA